MTEMHAKFRAEPVDALIRPPTPYELGSLEEFHAHATSCRICRQSLWNATGASLLCSEGRQGASVLCRLLEWNKGKACLTRAKHLPYEVVIEIPQSLWTSKAMLRAVANAPFENANNAGSHRLPRPHSGWASLPIPQAINYDDRTSRRNIGEGNQVSFRKSISIPPLSLLPKAMMRPCSIDIDPSFTKPCLGAERARIEVQTQSTCTILYDGYGDRKEASSHSYKEIYVRTRKSSINRWPQAPPLAYNKGGSKIHRLD